MSDLDVRRLTRELLRTGLDADQVLESVIAELRACPDGRFFIADHSKMLTYRTVPGRNPEPSDMQGVLISLRLGVRS